MRTLLVLMVGGLLAVSASAGIWDQLCPVDSYGGASWIDTDTPSDAQTADDFLCTGSGPITRIDWTGWSYYGEDYIDHFVISFWTDVPATSNDASHPGTKLWQRDVPVAYVSPPECGENHYRADFAAGDAFVQQQGTIYWISIQGYMDEDDYFDAWYWQFRERHEPTWGDDAAFTSTYFGNPPWYNWASPPGYGNPVLYDGPLPSGHTSLDMSFRLVPEPAGLLLTALGALLLRRR